MTTKVIELKDTDGNILLPHAYSASHDNNGDAFSSVYATITTVNTKADDSAVVHLSANEVITGIKTINVPTAGTNLIFKSNLIDTSTTPEENIYHHIDYRDKNDNLLARIFECRDIYGANVLALQTWNGSTQHWIGVNSSGYGIAPTPSDASDNSQKIATTAWVNNHLLVDENVVRTTGSQSIAGSKTFTQVAAPIYFKNNNVEQMTVPDAYSEQMVVGIDKNGVRIGSLGIAIDANGASRCYIASSKQINGEYKYNVIESYVDLNGNLFTYIEGQRLRAWVRETYISGTYWYRVYSDGWIEQGGITTVSAETTVTLPKAFSNTNYTAVCNPCDQATNATTDNNYEAHIKSRSTTGFNIKFWDSDSTSSRNGNVAWLAFGY